MAVEVEVIKGQVGISIANADYTELAAEAILTVEGQARTVVLPVPELTTSCALMMRNGSCETPSRAAISRVQLFAD